MEREYIVWKHFKNGISSERRLFNTNNDMKDSLTSEYNDLYKNDSDFIRIQIKSVPDGKVNYDLMDHMRCVREICELGHKVRANTKIKNRQPLRNAYITFSNRDVQDYMVMIDNNKFADIIGNELNIINVNFIDEKIEKEIFNFNIKPNFKSLGPKGFGKQAQGLKTVLSGMSFDERRGIYYKLKDGETILVANIPLTYLDVEIEFLAKDGFISATSKFGAIVLDTKLDDSLLDLGFIAEFRSSIQNIRKISGLNIIDKISIEIFGEKKRLDLINKFSSSLKRELLAIEINYASLDLFGSNKDPKLAHKIEIEKEELRVFLYKVG